MVSGASSSSAESKRPSLAKLFTPTLNLQLLLLSGDSRLREDATSKRGRVENGAEQELLRLERGLVQLLVRLLVWLGGDGGGGGEAAAAGGWRRARL